SDGSLVAIVKRADAFEEDCRRAVLVISAREAPPDCDALAIDRRLTQVSGSMALRRVEKSFEVTSARPRGYDRPWAHNVARNPASGSQPSGSANPPPRDATPRIDDLEAGD